VPFQFVSTHLDPFHTPLQPLQAGEILARVGSAGGPQLVVGDFNAGPTETTYAEMLAAGFVDVGLAAGAAGPTCCQPPDLDNPASQLTERSDYIFERGFSSIDRALLVGSTVFEDVRPLWPLRSCRGDRNCRYTGAARSGAARIGGAPARNAEVADR
jgi:endonuclease/exonuclease/phosphatase family metal-dependent hydrolase